MQNGIFQIGWRDFGKGAITAVIAGVLVSLYNVAIQAGFDVFTADWAMIGHAAVNAAVGGFVGYIGKNLLTDNAGKFLGVV